MASQTQTTDEPLAYTVDEFCQKARISRSTFYNEVKAGELEVCKVGDRTLVEPAEGRRWLASKRRGRAA
jgi:excisionase family DNA binding protein